jgi:acyl carrier protein
MNDQCILMDNMIMNAKNIVKKYILENFFFTDDDSILTDADSFIATGVIDSTGIVEIVTFLEDEFGVHIRPEEMLPENLDSVNKIEEFLTRKQAANS